LNPPCPIIALTLGEPAGIGPDIAIRLAGAPPRCRLAVIGSPSLLKERAMQIGMNLSLEQWRGQLTERGKLAVIDTPLPGTVVPGALNAANASYVLRCLDQAIDGCTSGRFDAMVTGPVHKGVINEAGIPFTGHTEYISERTASELPVMMLTCGSLRVALVTTHVPLKEVSALITRARVEQVIRVLIGELRDKFGLASPRVAVCGLNPHAGEQGHLGMEEIEAIAPAVEAFRERGSRVSGPHPADTVFLPHHADRFDVILAMYHDQGLPVLKYRGFSEAVNVTLGVPLIRTSVDHGTALELAGRPGVDTGSARAALELAIEMAQSRANQPPPRTP
jgi:4-hydroxythreonine-4-phosphate dehydrogenase